MDEVSVQRPKRRGPWIFIVILIFLMGASAVSTWFVVFRVNHFSLELSLIGAPEEVLEYGSEYREEGATVTLRGSLFWREGINRDIPVQIESRVNTGLLGKQPVFYYAEYRGYRAAGQRTVRVVDTQSPQITLVADAPETLVIPGHEYQEAGFSAYDNVDGDITDRVERYEEDGVVYYSVLDSSGNPCYAERQIPYSDVTPPEITLAEGEELVVPVGAFFSDPGYSAVDGSGVDLTEQVEITGEVDWFTPGEYTLTYSVTDEDDNTAMVSRHIVIQEAPEQTTVYPEGKVIYLTFDDGPGPYTEQLLRVLERYNVKATFFVVNTGYNDTMRKIVEQGHSIAIHTMSHSYQDIYQGPEAFFADLLGMQEIIFRETGVKTYLMRFPGGSSNTISCITPGLMTMLTQTVEKAGFRYVDWNVDSEDAGGAKTAYKVYENVTAGAAKQQISVVLQHDIHSFSVNAVEQIIQWGQKNGYTFLAMDMESPTVHHEVYN